MGWEECDQNTWYKILRELIKIHDGGGGREEFCSPDTLYPVGSHSLFASHEAHAPILHRL